MKINVDYSIIEYLYFVFFILLPLSQEEASIFRYIVSKIYRISTFDIVFSKLT